VKGGEPKMSENSNMMFCRKCGAKIPSDNEFCEICGSRRSITVTPTAETRVAVEKPKAGRQMRPLRIALIAVILAVILGGSFVILTTRWIPVVKHYQHSEEFPYSYSYTVTENRTVPHQEVILSSETVKLKAFKSYRQTDHYWISKGFRLEQGWRVHVVFTTDSTAEYNWVDVMVTDYRSQSMVQGNYMYYDSATRDGYFIAPRSGEFYVTLRNYDYYEHTASVEITAEWIEVQSEQRVENVTKTVTFDVTMYNVTYVSPIDLWLHRT